MSPIAHPRHRVELLTRAGCGICSQAADRLTALAAELEFGFTVTDVDVQAGEGRPGLRAEFGDRLPVVLLDGVEHSYWEVDEPRLRIDLAGSASGVDGPEDLKST